MGEELFLTEEVTLRDDCEGRCVAAQNCRARSYSGGPSIAWEVCLGAGWKPVPVTRITRRRNTAAPMRVPPRANSPLVSVREVKTAIVWVMPHNMAVCWPKRSFRKLLQY